MKTNRFSLFPYARNSRHLLGTRELVLMVAGIWALNAFAIDMMLPALGIISYDLGAKTENDQQLIIVIYLVFNGFAQLIFGPLVDRFGRRSVMLVSLAGYIFASILSVIATGFTFLLVARALQGCMTAGTRVAAIAIIRDRFAGREMAKVMSLVITIFMAAPIIAPGIGQLIFSVGSWRWLFIALMVYGIMLGLWALLRAPETLAPENRVPLKPSLIISNYMVFFKNPTSLGYTLASAFIFSSLFAFISASKQIFSEVFDIGEFFFFAFGSIALSLALASVTNARLVKRYGMRRISHLAMSVFVILGVLHGLLYLAGLETFLLFQVLMSFSFFSMGMIGPNFSSLAMEPMGKIAGSAGAANGFAGTTVAGILGGIIARFYNGTPAAILAGFVVMGLLAFATIAVVERGRLFEAGER